MHPPGRKFIATDDYHSSFPDHIRLRLDELRQIIQEVVPEATEVISYNMPAFKQSGGILVYYAGYKKHIGFYPAGPAAINEFRDELSAYKLSTGAIQFPLDQPFPVTIIKKIVIYRLARVQEKEKSRKK